MNRHVDRYENFAALRRRERADRDYAITVLERPSAIGIIAPHAGGIEPRTGEIARAIAGAEFNLYLFEGLKRSGNFDALHVTSTRFDEPRCVALVGRCTNVIAIHGCRGNEARVCVGGLDRALAESIAAALLAAGIRADTCGHEFPAVEPENIVNRGASGMGVQLEITRGLRGGRADAASLEKTLVRSIRSVLVNNGSA